MSTFPLVSLISLLTQTGWHSEIKGDPKISLHVQKIAYSCSKVVLRVLVRNDAWSKLYIDDWSYYRPRLLVAFTSSSGRLLHYQEEWTQYEKPKANPMELTSLRPGSLYGFDQTFTAAKGWPKSVNVRVEMKAHVGRASDKLVELRVKLPPFKLNLRG